MNPDSFTEVYAKPVESHNDFTKLPQIYAKKNNLAFDNFLGYHFFSTLLSIFSGGHSTHIFPLLA